VTTYVRDMVPGRAAKAAAVGALLAAVEATLAWRVGPTAALASFAYLGAVGTVVSVIDWRTRRLPDKVILPSYPITIALLAVASGVEQDWWPLARALIAAAVVAGFYLALALAFPSGMGFGDPKLGGLLALGLGWLGWPTLTTGVLAAWGLAAVAVITRGAIRSDERDRTIAFGPFLCLGALVAVVIR
jgi:leader peptidase (prepilin peptidase)/N-methyltransferase